MGHTAVHGMSKEQRHPKEYKSQKGVAATHQGLAGKWRHPGLLLQKAWTFPACISVLETQSPGKQKQPVCRIVTSHWSRLRRHGGDSHRRPRSDPGTARSEPRTSSHGAPGGEGAIRCFSTGQRYESSCGLEQQIEAVARPC